MVGVAGAIAAIGDPKFVRKYAAEVLHSRGILCKELDRLGWKYFPSDANFVLVRFGEHASAMRAELGEEEILVRDRSYEIAGCVRVTLGTRAQTRKLIAALRRATKRVRNDSR
jgi:histidinol-phosphate aminotransferase